MKVKIIDTLSYRTFHEVFNGAVVYMCMGIFERVNLYASPTTYANIQKLIARYEPAFSFSSLTYKTVSVVQSDSMFGGLIKYLLSAWLNIWHLWSAPRNAQVIYTNNNPLSLWGVVISNFLLRKKIVIFCHGELELLLRHPKFYKPSFFYKYIFKILFRYGYFGSRVKMCVLGDSILKHIRPYLNKRNQSSFFAIEHPYFFTQTIQNERLPETPLHLGTVGAMTYAKGLETLLNIASELGDRIHFSVVGRLMESLQVKQHPQIHFLGQKKRSVPRDEYEKAIGQLDFILFLYPTDTYQLIASGAIFDAMDSGKPIIAFSNSYFEHVLSCPMGYICKDESQMVDTIKKMTENVEKVRMDYPLFLRNIEYLKKRFDVKTVTSQFKRQLACIYM